MMTVVLRVELGWVGGELYSLSSAAKLVRHVFHAYAFRLISAGVILVNGLGIPA